MFQCVGFCKLLLRLQILYFVAHCLSCWAAWPGGKTDKWFGQFPVCTGNTVWRRGELVDQSSTYACVEKTLFKKSVCQVNVENFVVVTLILCFLYIVICKNKNSSYLINQSVMGTIVFPPLAAGAGYMCILCHRSFWLAPGGLNLLVSEIRCCGILPYGHVVFTGTLSFEAKCPLYFLRRKPH